MEGDGKRGPSTQQLGTLEGSYCILSLLGYGGPAPIELSCETSIERAIII